MQIHTAGTEPFYKSKSFVLIVAVVVLTAVSLLLSAFTTEKVVKVIDEGETYELTVYGYVTVEDLLSENNLELNEKDEIDVTLDSWVENGSTITINRAVAGEIVVDGEVLTYLSAASTVEEVLEEEEVQLGELDIVTPALDTEITADVNEIKVVRVIEKTEEREEEIAFASLEEENAELESGITNIIQEGENGLETVTEKKVYYDGELVSTEEVSREVTKEPVNEILEVGTYVAPVVVVDRGEERDDVTAGTSMIVNASAYTGGSYTASGAVPTPWYTIAAGPSLPFGTRVYIPALGATFVVQDRGGSISDYHIDIYFATEAECLSFGRQDLEIIILE